MDIDFRHRLNKALYSHDGIQSVTNKLTIGDAFDVYVQTGWFEGELGYIEIYLCGMHDLNIRALVEQACMDARKLIGYKISDADELARGWRGREFEPNGFCPQLMAAEEGQIASAPRSILDAVARLIQCRKKEWTKDSDCDKDIDTDKA